MEANELMIGDLVKTSNNANWSEDLRGLICKITIVGNSYIASSSIDSPGRNPYGNSISFEPIHLTKEILEKSGFILDEYSTYYLPINEGSVRFSKHQYGWYCNILCAYQKYSGVCNYVHQLQHALRLCGIEKELEL